MIEHLLKKLLNDGWRLILATVLLIGGTSFVGQFFSGAFPGFWYFGGGWLWQIFLHPLPYVAFYSLIAWWLASRVYYNVYFVNGLCGLGGLLYYASITQYYRSEGQGDIAYYLNVIYFSMPYILMLPSFLVVASMVIHRRNRRIKA